MGKLVVVAVIVVLLSGFAWASQPGHPIDCSDWVFLEPGHACGMTTPVGSIPPDSTFLRKGGNQVVDNAGSLVAIRVNAPTYNGQPRLGLGRVEILRFEGQTESVIAYLEDRMAADGGRDHVRTADSSCTNPLGNCQGGNSGAGTVVGDMITFDAVNGRLLIPLESYCASENFGCPSPSYHGGWWYASISGFATLFEILQTYTPTANDLGFRVPAIPEGLRAADHFDTYWGHVADLPDFTAAQPMKCSYPPTPPHVGNYFTVPDISPVPYPGEANYSVTAVTYGPDRRYGRKRIGGVMSGRDPALLPVCPAATTAQLSSGSADVVP